MESAAQCMRELRLTGCLIKRMRAFDTSVKLSSDQHLGYMRNIYSDRSHPDKYAITRLLSKAIMTASCKHTDLNIFCRMPLMPTSQAAC